MRRVLGLAAGVAVLVMAAVYAVASTLLPALLQQANAEPQTCLATAVPAGNGEQGAGQVTQLGPEQQQIAGAIIAHGQQRQLPARAWQVAIQAGKTESNLRNLSYGDRDSVGIFQMRTSMGWGTPAQLQNVDYQVNKFYDVLLEVPGWEQMRPGQAAQRVERSAYPQRYHQWEDLALALISDQAGLENPSGCDPAQNAGADAENPAARKAIEAALSKQGAPYVWGAKGPGRFDCSGLMYWAYEQAGVTLPMGSWMQYEAGQQVPLDQAQPGDLVFWASNPDEPGSIHHVAMYLGNGQIVQAPYSEEPVQVSELRGNGITSDEELMSTAVRPGVGA